MCCCRGEVTYWCRLQWGLAEFANELTKKSTEFPAPASGFPRLYSAREGFRMRFSRADEKMKQGLHEEIFTAADLLVARAKTSCFIKPRSPGRHRNRPGETRYPFRPGLSHQGACRHPKLDPHGRRRSQPSGSKYRPLVSQRPQDKRCITPRCLAGSRIRTAGLAALLSAACLPAHQRGHCGKNLGGTSGIFSGGVFCLFRSWVHAFGIHY